MTENRIRLGPFALKLIAKHGPKGTPPDGKFLDELLIKALADGKAFDLGIAGDIAERLKGLPEWEAYKSDLVTNIDGAVDGIGNQLLDEFERLNKRIDGMEKNLSVGVNKTGVLSEKIDALTKLINERLDAFLMAGGMDQNWTISG